MDENLSLEQEMAAYRRRAVVAVQTAFLFAALIVVFFDPGGWPVILAILVSAALSALSIWMTMHSRPVSAAFILALQFLALPTYLALTAIGTYDPAMLIYPAGMIAMSVVAKPLPTAAFAVLSMVCISFVALSTYNNWFGNPLLTDLIAKNPSDIVAAVVIVGFSGIVSTYVSAILASVLRKLAEHQAALERNIFVRTRELSDSNNDLRQAALNLDRARVELVRGEKLAGLGSLVAGVSHELNTPIGNSAVTASALLHHVSEFHKQVEGGTLRKSDLQVFLHQCAEGAELIVSSTQRAAELVASFKQVAVDQTSDRRRDFELNDTVQDVLRSMRPSFKGRDWVIECDIPPGIHCDGYPGPLGQVITNLVQNAVVHGFHGRGHGTLKVKLVSYDSERVQLTITDDGHGISAESVSKIFDPFFTTRLGQGGSGLGLAIVHNLVTVMLGGRIDVASTVGQGTCFALSFPRAAPRNVGVNASVSG